MEGSRKAALRYLQKKFFIQIKGYCVKIKNYNIGGGNLRIQCVFSSSLLPVSYNMLFVSLIKECIKKVDENYFNELFYYEDKTNKKSKNYSFSVKLGRFNLNKNLFEIIDGDIVFTLSSPDEKFIVNFYNGLLKISDFNYKNFVLKRKKYIYCFRRK